VVPSAISYQLVIDLERPVRCTIGRLGTFEFPAGRYLYTGSAKRGLEARISRHVGSRTTMRWHVDYLLSSPGVTVTKVIRSRRDECRLNQASPGSMPVPGFGASDCAAGCCAHLKYCG
jgi:Uri superfamily endonuclease